MDELSRDELKAEAKENVPQCATNLWYILCNPPDVPYHASYWRADSAREAAITAIQHWGLEYTGTYILKDGAPETPIAFEYRCQNSPVRHWLEIRLADQWTLAHQMFQCSGGIVFERSNAGPAMYYMPPPPRIFATDQR